MRDSAFKLTEAKYAAGEKVKHTIFDNVESAKVKVTRIQDNVAGVQLPKYACETVEGESKMDLTGKKSWVGLMGAFDVVTSPSPFFRRHADKYMY